MKCISCSSIEHKEEMCPLLHYLPVKTRLIAKHNFSEPIVKNLTFQRKRCKY